MTDATSPSTTRSGDGDVAPPRLPVPLPTFDRRFPATFAFGTATSSYQIEGAVDVDGRTPSIWDTFASVPGAVADGDTGAIAVDHYHRWAQDLDLLAWLGVDAYRFSIAWPRVVPDASGRPNQAGLDFYRRLVEGLHQRGIEPSVTLYHWDLPQWLQDRGGWAGRGVVDAFVDYAGVVAEALGTVGMWTTHNEPWCAAFLGHRAGVHAPGSTDSSAAVAACHHLLLAHGRAVPVLREVAGHERDDEAQVGIVLNVAPIRTPGTTAADHEAVRVVDGGRNRAWLDPLFRGTYPADVLADWAAVADLSVIRDDDLTEISRPIDFLGINYYNPIVVAAGEGSSPEPGADGVVGVPPEGESTAMGWPIDATGLGEIALRVVGDYGPIPLWITENGAAFDDDRQVPGPDGASVVDDHDRIRYVAAHLRAVHDLVSSGVDVRGYFLWSLLDNFEWAEGYRRRFGVVHVDHDTLERTPKASAHWYRMVIGAGNGLTDD